MDLFQLSISLGLTIIVFAFMAETMDSTLGMGYGTSLTPILLIMGFDPLQVVPSILVSELVTGLLAGFTHHSVGNVDFRPKTMNPVKMYMAIRNYGFRDSFSNGIPLHLRIVMLIAGCSIIGTVFAVFIAVSIPKFYLKLYIGCLIVLIGFVILLTLKRNYEFSWKKIIGLGLIASFNKGMSGGGYGPVVTGGQLLSGIGGKNAVGITSLAEGLTCVVGVVVYHFSSIQIDWVLAPYLVVGAILSVPFSALFVKKMNVYYLKAVIGFVTLVLGVVTLVKLFI